MAQNYSPLVYMEDVTKVFRTGDVETRVLAGIDLEIQRGEYVLLLGPSGCGKSTLLSIMGLMDSPTTGTYVFGGKPVNNLNASDRARIRNHDIGFVFQSFNLINDMTVFENVEQPLTYQKLKPAERKDRVSRALETVGMGHQAKRRPSQISGGEQQKVAIARAIVGNPQILMADEPTGNLDSASGEAVMQLLRKLHQGGTTVCMVTHDERFVKLADRLLHMLDGRIQETSEWV